MDTVRILNLTPLPVAIQSKYQFASKPTPNINYIN